MLWVFGSSIPTDPWSPAAFLQCSEAQKLLNITKELLHTEEAYVKRLNLLDQVTAGLCRRLSVAHGGGRRQFVDRLLSTFQFRVCACPLSNWDQSWAGLKTARDTGPSSADGISQGSVVTAGCACLKLYTNVFLCRVNVAVACVCCTLHTHADESWGVCHLLGL